MNRTMVLVFMFIAGCSNSTYDITVERSGATVVTGTFDRSLFESDSSMNVWYRTRYDQYSVDTTFIPLIRNASNDIHYVIILGTWCGDSKREIPHLMKIFDAASVTQQRMTFYGVDRAKKSGSGIEEKYSVDRVPTIIVMKGKREIGRIVEMPVESLEYDLGEILKKQ